MFAFDAPLFWYKLVFMGELMLAEGLATYSLRKRRRFVLRAVAGAVGALVVAFLYPLPDLAYNAAYTSVMFLLLFACTLAAMKLCYDEPWVNLLFCGIIAYTTQHVSYETYNFLVQILNATGLINVTSAYDGAGSYEFNGFALCCWLGAYGVIYWLVWAFVEYRIRLQDDLKIDNIPLLCYSAVIIVIDILLNALVMYAGEDISMLIYTVVYVYNLLSCSLAIGMLFSMLGKKLAEKELETVEALWQQDKKAYEMARRNVELINVKCHDLRKQIRALRTAGGEVDKAALAEVEHAVNIYDGSVKTGSRVLDVLLAEKTLYCESNGISFAVIADGARLAFMSPSDEYSLLENALSNAMEATVKLPDRDRRVVRLHIRAVGDMLSVHVENTYGGGPLRMVDGLPVTSKTEERGWHGYGVRSMRLIAEKYGGGLNVMTSGDMFYLDILLPLPRKEGK